MVLFLAINAPTLWIVYIIFFPHVGIFVTLKIKDMHKWFAGHVRPLKHFHAALIYN